MNNRISELRKERGWTQDIFAEKMGISKNYVSLIENGKKIPSDRLVSDICQEFDVNENWLRTGKGEKKVKKNIVWGDICADISANDPKAREAIMKYYELSDEDKELWWKWMETFLK